MVSEFFNLFYRRLDLMRDELSFFMEFFFLPLLAIVALSFISLIIYKFFQKNKGGG